MKSPILPSITGVAVLTTLLFTSCKEEKPVLTPEQQQQEIDRLVQQKLAEEKVALAQQTLDQKAQDLAAREQQLAQREQASATQTPRASEPDARPAYQSAPEPAAERGIVVDEPASNRAPGSYDVFYNALDRYGAWFEVPRYGLVWQPNTAAQDPGWRPYTVGHWAYTDQGWAWISDEPFGWAAYHYGRWTRLVNTGWVWVPGDQWAPAWVSWRNNDNYVGWAPLPPESSASVTIREGADSDYNIAPAFYSFVDTSNFGNEDLSPALVESGQNVTIINQTRNVTNIFVNNTVVFNQGPSIEVVQRRSHRHIDMLKVDRRSNLPSGETHAIRANVLEVRAPIIERGQPPQHRPAVQRKIELVDVDRSTPPPQQHRPRPEPSHPAQGPQFQRPSAAQATPSQPQSAPSQVVARPSATPVAPVPRPAIPVRPVATPWATPDAAPVSPDHKPLPRAGQPVSPGPVQPVQRPLATPSVAPSQVARPATPMSQPTQLEQPRRPLPPRELPPQPVVQRQVEPQRPPQAEPPRRPEPPVVRPSQPERRIETPRPTEAPRPERRDDSDKDKHDKKG